MAVDPVCGKHVDEEAVNATVGRVAAGAVELDPSAGAKRFYGGRWYYFCSLACRQKFLATPDEYVRKLQEQQ